MNPAVSEDMSTDHSRGRVLHAHVCAPPQHYLLICSLSPEVCMCLHVSLPRNLDWPDAGTLLASQNIV